MFDLIAYQRGLWFLHKYFVRSYAFPMGDAGESKLRAMYSDDQIATIGKLTQDLDEFHLQNAISKALAAQPTQFPNTAEWTTYLNEGAVATDYLAVTGAGLADAGSAIAKTAAITAGVGASAYLLYLAIPAILLLMAGKK